MLVFILQQNRVVVVNNEVGFTPANMKALCDVGNSTKSGSGAGYIGHKGIGFKSVFRVSFVNSTFKTTIISSLFYDFDLMLIFYLM